MTHGSWKWGAAGALIAGVMTAAVPPSGSAQTTGAPQSGTAIPEAPRPQTLPTIPSVAPAVTNLPPTRPQAIPPPSNEPGSTLPSTPAPQQAATEPASDDGTVTGDAALKQFTLAPVNVQFVEVPFTVKDSKNQLVPGIKAREVQVFENGYKQQIRLFTSDPFPLSVALVIDQSVTQDVMTKINNSLTALQGAFTRYDEVAVFTYNNGVKMQDDAFDAAQGPRLAAILQRSKAPGREPMMVNGGPLAYGNIKNNQIVDPNTTGNSSRNGLIISQPKEFHTLYDAIFAAAQQTTKAGKGRRRIVYVISDGKEYGSKVSQKDVVRYCQTNNIAVYATLVGDSSVPAIGFLDRIHLPLTMRDDVLPKVAQATGGQIDAEFRQRGIENSFAKITEEVRTQYTLGYYSREPAIDGKFRRVEVRVLRPGLTINAKDGYYPRPTSAGAPSTAPAATP